MTENIPAPSPRRDVFTPAYRILVLLLLLGILIVMVFGLLSQALPSMECQAAIAKAGITLDYANSILETQLDDYSYAVYDSPSVETINQQIFRANEFQFMTLDLIATQNSALLEVIANCE